MRSILSFLIISLFAAPSWAQGSAYNLEFNGTTSRVKCGVLNLSGSALTMEAWVKVDNFKSSFPFISSILGIEAGSSNTALLRFGDASIPANRLQMVLNFSGSQVKLDGVTNLSTGTWYHVAATYDGSNMRIYLNGNLESSSARSGSFSANDTLFVARNYGNDRILDGSMEEVRIWKAAVSQNDLQKWMCQKINSGHTNYSNLELYYPMDEGSGSTTTDASGNGHTGTLLNSPSWNRSSAPIGDTAVYTNSSSSNLSYGPVGNQMSLTSISGNPSLTYLYKVDTMPLGRQMPSSISSYDSSAYWGVYFVGGTNPTATMTYSYGNSAAFLNSGSCLVDLAYRTDGSDSTWVAVSTSLSSSSITKTSRGSGEYIATYFENNSIYPKDSVSLCIGVNLVLSHSSTGLQYTWYKNGSLIPGQTSNRYVASDSGFYKMVLVAGSCSDTSNEVHLVKRALPQVSLSGLGGACSTVQYDTLQGGIPSGGIFSGTYVSGNLFASSQAGVGKHTVVYQYTDSTGCKDTAHSQIEVYGLPVVDFRPVTPRCANAPAFTLTTGTPAGGVYTQAGDTISSFNPTKYSSGLQQVWYYYTDSNSCSNSKSIYVRLLALPEVVLDLDTSFCLTNPPYQLPGSPSGGIYSGTGVSFGGFFPDSAGVGIHEITYSRTDSVNFCSNSIKDSIEVVAFPAKPIISRTGNILHASAGYSYEWFNAQGTSRSTDSSFTPGQEGRYYLIVTNATGCSSESSDTLDFAIVGLNEALTQDGWNVVQPLSGQLKVLSSVDSELHLEIFSIDGKKQTEILLESGGEALISLNAGLYLVRELETGRAQSVLVY